MRIGIYNHQHLRGGCPGCSQVYVKGMISDAMACQNRAIGVYGEGCEFFNYTDLGDYPPKNLIRPGFRRMMQDIISNRLDAVIVVTLSKISSEVSLVLETYQKCRKHNVDLLTLKEGKNIMKDLDEALKKWEENLN